MTLAPGVRLGPYEVSTLIGVGGMGEVYQATDTKLKRQVAIKILPPALASDPDRLARVQREAEVLASLNHPNIAHIYGLEEARSAGSGQAPIKALVMELVEGPTLADRISQGPIPFDEALPIATQITEALDAAHEQGVTHRDLKPANIKVRPDGMVKVLDFGLAKVMEPGGVDRGGGVGLSQSPTITTPAVTQAGMILGTAAYMSPEQARGKPVDRRTDIWAFGCVLYEMLTGRRAFDADDVSLTMARVLEREVDIDALPDAVPARVRQVLRVCLRKDSRQRAGDIRDVRLALEGAFETAVPKTPAEAVVAPSRWHGVATALGALGIGAVAAGAAVWVATRPVAPPLARFLLSGSASAPVVISDNYVDVAISPDGARVAYIAGPQQQIYVRAIDKLDATPLQGTDNAAGPFFSPDGNWIAFYQNDLLRKTSILGGAPVTLAHVGIAFEGGSWGADDSIVFASSGGSLFRVRAGGGERVPLITTDASSGAGVRRYWHPEILPGGRAVLFTESSSDLGNNTVVSVLELETARERRLIPGGSSPRYVPTGHIVYGVDGTLRAVPFDQDRLAVSGDPVLVLDGVMTKRSGAANFGVASEGSLVYVAGRADVGAQQTITWVNRQGLETALAGIAPNTYRDVRVSPDGARVAVATNDDVFTYDVARATLARLTTHKAPDHSPLWTPDGDRIVFTSMRSNFPELFWRRADGSGDDERVLTRDKTLRDLRANGWSLDGSQMLFTEVPRSIQCAIGQIANTGGAEARMLVQREFCSDYAAVSPDGRWLVHTSWLSGRPEIYVERYPELRDRQKISTEGGSLPLWSKDGRELFFSSLDGRQILAVAMRSGATLIAGRPVVLFEGTYRSATTGGVRSYDVAPDGRFVMIKLSVATGEDAPPPTLVVVQHWVEELKRLVPAK